MTRQRPASILVIAILQFVFGGLGLLCGLYTAAQLAVGNQLFTFGANTPQAQQQEQFQEQLEKSMLEKDPYVKQVQYGTTGVELFLSLMMIASGIGLLKMQSWGRLLCLVYSVLSISLKVFTAVYTLLFTVPAIKEFAQSLAAKGPQEAMMAKFIQFSAYAGVAWPSVTVVYPLVVLVIMLLPPTRAAFRGERVARPEEEPPDYRDEPDLAR
jgi:hypothetical protein